MAAGDYAAYTDLGTIIALTYNRPIVRLIQQVAQAMATGADVNVTFGAGSEEVDTHDFHDVSTNTSRITPKVPGWYRLTGTVHFAATTTMTNYWANIAKNGTIQAPRMRVVLPATATTALVRALTVTMLLSANGSTDYFELIGQQNSGGSINTSVGAGTASVFECEYIRSL